MKNEMNHDELSAALDKRVFDHGFHSLGLSKKRHACPCCCPGADFKMNWCQGYSYDDDMNERHAFQCNNCGHTEYYTPRKPRTDRTTKSQERAVQRVKDYFTQSHTVGEATFETKLEDNGTLWLYVRNDHLYGTTASFTVGRGGKLTCWGAHCVLSDRKQETKHVAAMVRAKVSKHA